MIVDRKTAAGSFTKSALAFTVTIAAAVPTLGNNNEVVRAKTVQAPAARAAAKPRSLNTPACRAFRDQAFPSTEPGKPGAATEQFVILRDGQPLLDWSDGSMKKDSARAMWSISKTVTATLMAAAIQDGKVKLDDPVVKYLPEILKDARVDRKRFSQIKVRDLLAMTSGLQWNENDKVSTREQSVLDLLHSKGYRDMTAHVSRLPFASEPGTKWNYATVNAILSMAILKKVYGTEANDMPWNKLFKPLGMKSVRFEKDRTGTYVGGAYVHMSARDLAKLGQLYLNDGVAGGKRLLPENWVSSMASASVPMTAKNIEGLKQFNLPTAYSQGGFWLNKSVDGRPRPYPNLPESMILAGGLLGQSLVILPEQNIVIARTGHDKHDSEMPLDSVVANALKCYAPDAPGLARNTQPVQPKSTGFKLPSPKDAFEGIDSLNYISENGRLAGMLAKEICSCRFITGLGTNECISRTPVPTAMAHLLNNIQVDEAKKTVTVHPRFANAPAQGSFNKRSPREGCRMSYGYADHVQQSN